MITCMTNGIQMKKISIIIISILLIAVAGYAARQSTDVGDSAGIAAMFGYFAPGDAGVMDGTQAKEPISKTLAAVFSCFLLVSLLASVRRIHTRVITETEKPSPGMHQLNSQIKQPL